MANNYIYVNGVQVSDLYANGILQDNVYMDGELVYVRHVIDWYTVWTGSKTYSSSAYVYNKDFGENVDFSRPTKISGNGSYQDPSNGGGTADYSFSNREITASDTVIISDSYYNGGWGWEMGVSAKLDNGKLSLLLGNVWFNEMSGTVMDLDLSITINELKQYY